MGSSSLPPSVGHFTPLRRLGGAGITYLADGPEGQVALKLGQDAESQARNQQEAELLGSLEHPFVARLVDHDPDGRWLATAWVEGQSAGEWSRGRPLTEVVDLLARVSEATAHLHARGIVHGDLKPSNVLVDDAARPTLIDLGVGIRMATGNEAGFQGTLGYVAPEHLAGGPLSPSADIYALGVLAYELVTGSRPFRADDAAALAWLPIKSLPMPASSLRPRIPTQLDQLILHLLARTPEQRPDDASVVAAGLRACLAGTSAEPVLGMHKTREALRRLVVDAADGAGVVAVVHGPRGSGRRTLIKEAMAHARREGLRVVRRRVAGPASAHRSWGELLEELRRRPSVIELRGGTPEVVALGSRVLSEGVGALVLVRSLHPVPPLQVMGAPHLSPPPLDLESLGTLLDLAGVDRRRGEEVRRMTKGRPGAVLRLLNDDGLPQDLDPDQLNLLRILGLGPHRIEALAAQLAMSEHDVLDVADPLLDRGLVVEVQQGAALQRGT